MSSKWIVERKPRLQTQVGAPAALRQRRQGLLLPAFAFLCVAALAGGLLVPGAAEHALPTVGLAVLLLSLTSAILAGLMARPDFDVFSPITVFTAMVGVFYGGGVLFMELGSGYWHSQAVDVRGYAPTVALLACGGLLMYTFGFQWTKSRLLSSHNSSRMSVKSGSFVGLWVLIFLSGWGARTLLYSKGVYLQSADNEIPVTLMGLVGPLLQFPQVSLVLAVGRALSVRTTKGEAREARRWKWIALFLIALEMAYALPTGSKGRILASVMVVAFCANYGYRRISPRAFAVGFATAIGLFVFLAPISQHYRDATVSSGLSSDQVLSVDAIGDALVGGLDTYNSGDADARWREAIDYSSMRLNSAVTMGRILRYFDRGGAPKWGETYLLVAWTVVPRILWPSKPNIAIGNQFGIEVGFMDSGITSIAITQMGEWLFNFGYAGVIIGMWATGALFALIYVRLIAGIRRGDAVAMALGYLVWFETVFLGVESNFAGIVGGVSKSVLVFILLALAAGFRPVRNVGEVASGRS